MKVNIPILIILIVVSISCSNSGNTSSSGSLEPTKKDMNNDLGWSTEVLQKIPTTNNFFSILDVHTIRKDKKLKNVYQSLLIESSDLFSTRICSLDQLEYWAFCGDFDLLLGRIDVDEAQNILSNDGWSPDQYGGFNTWEWESMIIDYIVIDNDLAIVGSKDPVLEAIQTINSNHISIYENDDIMALINRLPTDGFEIGYMEQALAANNGSNGILRIGATVAKESEQLLRYTWVASQLNSIGSDSLIEMLVDTLSQDNRFNSEIEATTTEEYVVLTTVAPSSNWSFGL